MPLRTQVGRTLVRRRAAARLSLAGLAEASGVSKSTLHEIEQGDANPRLDTLYAIATALGIGIAELLDEPTPPVTVVRAGEGPVVRGDAVTAWLLFGLPAPGRIEVYAITVGPTPQRSEAHVGGTSECLMVISGAVRVGPVGDEVDLGPGDAVHFMAGVEHTYRSLDDDGGDARALLVVLVP